MAFTVNNRLKNLALSVSSFEAFIKECAKWRKYAVTIPTPWTKADYRRLYDEIRGGTRHEYTTKTV